MKKGLSPEIAIVIVLVLVAVVLAALITMIYRDRFQMKEFSVNMTSCKNKTDWRKVDICWDGCDFAQITSKQIKYECETKCSQSYIESVCVDEPVDLNGKSADDPEAVRFEMVVCSENFVECYNSLVEDRKISLSHSWLDENCDCIYSYDDVCFGGVCGNPVCKKWVCGSDYVVKVEE